MGRVPLPVSFNSPLRPHRPTHHESAAKDHPRLFLRDEIISSIANQIQDAGNFDEAHALLVRPIDGHYQIIQGHHRKEGAAKAGLDSVPCWAREMTDDEAYMQLVLGNVQGELSPLEIGIHALKVKFDKRGKGGKGGGLRGYADNLGKNVGDITTYRQAANVLKSINLNIQINEKDMIDKAVHLAHIHKAHEGVWPLLARWLITPNGKGKTPSNSHDASLILSELGINWSQSSRWQREYHTDQRR